MPLLSRRTFLELAGASLVCGCNAASLAGDARFPVLAFSDIHFDPFFDPLLFGQLDASDPGQWAGIFASSAVKTPSMPGADTNFPLLAMSLASIRLHRDTSPCLLFTGDLLGHGIGPRYFAATGSSDVAAMYAFTDKIVTFVAQQIRAAAGNAPVLFAVGNCDSYTGYGPDSAFLSNTADLFFTTMLKGTADRKEFFASFTAGGYYAAEPAGLNLVVIGMNTIMFSPSVQNKDGSENNQPAVNAELDWLDGKLATAKVAGKRVWLLMHAPPGLDEGTTAGSVQSNGHIAGATMMWEANYLAEFIRVLRKYPGLITFILAGHTHMDEYRIICDDNVVEVVPGISPVFTNNPAYKLFQLNGSTLAPADYDSLSYNPSASPDQFNVGYAYSRAFPAAGSLASSRRGLVPRLARDLTLQSAYRAYFTSGSCGAYSITDFTWPVYWSGIGNMTESEIVASVNSYADSP